MRRDPNDESRSADDKVAAEKGFKKAKRPPLTHFLCLPLVNSSSSRLELLKALDEFKGNVCAERTGSITLPEKSVRPVGSLHLTLGVMSLDKASLERAVRVLQQEVTSLPPSLLLPMPTAESISSIKDVGNNASSFESSSAVPVTLSRETTPPPTNKQAEALLEASTPAPIRVSLTSLHPMQSPRKTSVLYAAPHDATSRLLRLAQHLRDRFTAHGLLVPDDRPLKLHATLVNTIYIRGQDKEVFIAQQQRSRVVSEPAVANEADDVEASAGTSAATGSTTAARGQGTSQKISPAGPTKPKKAAKGPLRFDATAILERHRDTIWARDILIDRVAICEMGAKNVLDADGNVVDAVYHEKGSALLYPDARDDAEVRGP